MRLVGFLYVVSAGVYVLQCARHFCPLSLSRCLRANRLAVCVYCFYFQLLTDITTVFTKQNILARKYMMATC